MYDTVFLVLSAAHHSNIIFVSNHAISFKHGTGSIHILAVNMLLLSNKKETQR